MKPLFGIQYFRGIAAVLVVISHINAMSSFPKYFGREVFSGLLSFKNPYHLDLGLEAVYLFFVLSGFIMVYVSLDDQLKPKLSLKEFFQKRMIRILPFMWFTILLYAILKWFGNGQFPFGNYLSAIFLYPFNNNIEPKQIWTLTHEFLFYTLFGLFFIKFRKLRFLIFVWFLISVINFSLKDGALTFFFSKYNILFGLGVVVGIIFKKINTIQNKTNFFTGFSLIAITLCFALIGLVRPLFENSYILILISGLIFSSLLFLSSFFTINKNSIAHLILLKIGDASFSIYLTHGMCLSIGLKVWSKLQYGANLYLVLITITLLTIFIGYMIHVKIEKPLISFLNNYLKIRNGRRSEKRYSISNLQSRN